MAEDWKERLAIFDYLISRKFPFRRFLKQPNFKNEAWRQSYAAEISLYQAELGAKTFDEVLALHRAEKGKELEAHRARLELEDKLRPHHGPQSKADYATWAEIPSWSLDEGIALSLDRDPRQVSARSLEPYTAASSFAQEFFRRQMIAMRVAADGGLQTPRTRSTIFLRWMQKMAFDPPRGLVEAVEQRGPHAEDFDDALTEHSLRFPAPKILPTNVNFRAALEANIQPIKALLSAKDEAIAQRDAELARLSAELAAVKERKQDQTATRDIAAKDRLSTAEKNSLLKLVIGLAVGGYAFDPNAGKSAVPPEIAADLEKLGIALDADTVRKYLREGATLLPSKPLGEKPGKTKSS